MASVRMAERVEGQVQVEDLGMALTTVGRAYWGRLAAALTDLPHGPRGYQVLLTVVSGEQQSQLALAACVGVDRSVMVYLVDDLVAAGLVERRPNPTDRRQRQIVPTEHGLAVVEDLRRKVRAVEDDLLRALAPAEREVFREMITRVSAGLDHGASPGGNTPGDADCDGA